jgi:hypothetical protein
VVEIARRQRGKARGERESLGVPELKGRREIELLGLALDGGDDRLAVVAGVAAPQAGGASETRRAPASRS